MHDEERRNWLHSSIFIIAQTLIHSTSPYTVKASKWKAAAVKCLGVKNHKRQASLQFTTRGFVFAAVILPRHIQTTSERKTAIYCHG